MAAETFHIGQGDTLPRIEGIVRDDRGVPIDLSAVTEVRFRMMAATTRELLVDGEGEVGVEAGEIYYEWVSGDTDRVGRHLAEFQISFTGPTVMTVPNDPGSPLAVLIVPQLA